MPHGSRIRPKQIAEAFEDRRFYATRVHGVLKGWSIEVWTPQLGEAGVLEGKVHEGFMACSCHLTKVKGWTAVLTKKTFQLTSPTLRNRTRYSNCEMTEAVGKFRNDFLWARVAIATLSAGVKEIPMCRSES